MAARNRVEVFRPVQVCLPVLTKLLEIYNRDRNSLTREVIHCAALVITTGQVGHVRNMAAELQGVLADAFPAARDFVRPYISCPEADSAPLEALPPDEKWRRLLELTHHHNREGGRHAA